MTTMYATPAAANYYVTPSRHHKERGARLCDACGAVENPTVRQFRLCGGCVCPFHIQKPYSETDSRTIR